MYWCRRTTNPDAVETRRTKQNPGNDVSKHGRKAHQTANPTTGEWQHYHWHQVLNANNEKNITQMQKINVYMLFFCCVNKPSSTQKQPTLIKWWSVLGIVESRGLVRTYWLFWESMSMLSPRSSSTSFCLDVFFSFPPFSSFSTLSTASTFTPFIYKYKETCWKTCLHYGNCVVSVFIMFLCHFFDDGGHI